MSPSEVECQAAKIDLRADCGEPIRVVRQPKPNGGFRILTKFGVERTAEQLICRDLLQVLCQAPMADFSLGGGTSSAAMRVLDLHEQGCDFFVVADVQDCFGSLAHDGVKRALPLPKAVVENTINVNSEINKWKGGGTNQTHKVAPIRDYYNMTEPSCRRGIPQGSSVSNLVAALMLDEVIRDADPDRVVVYRDDFAIGASTHEEAVAISHAFKDRFLKCRAGPLTLKFCEIRSVEDGFDFLGYRFKVCPPEFGGHFRARPSPRSNDRFRLGLIERCIAGPLDQVCDVAHQYAQQWLASFGQWHRQPGESDYFEAMVDDIAGTVASVRS